MHEETQYAIMSLVEQFTSQSSYEVLYDRKNNAGLRVLLEKWTRDKFDDTPRYVLDVQMGSIPGQDKTRLLQDISADWQAIEVARSAYLAACACMDEECDRPANEDYGPPF